MFSAYLSTSVIGAWSECMARIMIGLSDGLIARNVGGLGMFLGSEPSAALIASSTSVSALAMLVLRPNCSVICVVPSTLAEVICDRPGSIWPNSVSSGVATVAAIVAGLAPGYCAVTVSVGNSTFGSGATGSSGYATRPARKIAAVSRDVAIGRRMNGVEMLIGKCSSGRAS